jgi:hypothetical protein
MNLFGSVGTAEPPEPNAQEKTTMNHPLRNSALNTGLNRQLRQVVVLLTILIWLPAWSHPGPPAAAALPARMWIPGPVYMQIGKSCVGYALAAWLDAAPYPIVAHPSGWQIYRAAQGQDGITGLHDGTTVEAGLAVLARLGYARDWQATSDPARALAFLRADGPLVILSGFPDGPAVLNRNGDLAWSAPQSRHAWLCYSVDAGDRLGCQNSASSYWNPREGGRFHMTRAALASALAHGRAWLIHKAAAGPAL